MKQRNLNLVGKEERKKKEIEHDGVTFDIDWFSFKKSFIKKSGFPTFCRKQSMKSIG